MRKIKSIICNDEGSAIGVFVIILLSMTILATTTVTLAQTQFKWSQFSRQTSNSYQLARSGAEKTVDSMNKEIAKALPKLMDQASKKAHEKLMLDGLKYEEGAVNPGFAGEEKYTGEFKGINFENRYEIELKKQMYAHVVDVFKLGSAAPVTGAGFNAKESDVKSDIKVKTNIYKYGDLLANIPDDLESSVADLININLLDDPTDGPQQVGKDAFLVEVIAWAEETVPGGGAVTKPSLTKSRVVGTINLDQIDKNEALLEEYEWDKAYPESLQAAVISFGDFIINGDNNKATITGDIQVKGTIRPPATVTEAASGDFPEPDEFGGIVISNGGKLKVTKNAMAVGNIQTTNSYANHLHETTIDVGGDAIASTIAINDHYPDTQTPWLKYVMNNKIEIGRNAFLDNDLRVDRYVRNGYINVTNSVFGISDGDSLGAPGGGVSYVDPNKSSGIYYMGECDPAIADNRIKVGRAFIAGQAYINFDDNTNYHRLYESAGEPFEDVYYLDDYRTAYGSDSSYTSDLKELIEKNKVVITERNGTKPKGFAPAFVSESDNLHDIGMTTGEGFGSFSNHAEARKIFYLGVDGDFATIKADLTSAADWDSQILPEADGVTYQWASTVNAPYDFYNRKNPFDKDYGINATDYAAMQGHKGLQAYMLAKRGVFYKEFGTSGGTDIHAPQLRKFNDLIRPSVFSATATHEWTRNNPIELVNTTKSIDIAKYKGKPTALVCMNPDAVITLTNSGSGVGDKPFRGIIITAGKLNIEANMTIEGPVIVGNENGGNAVANDAAELDGRNLIRQNIRSGKYAGIQISGGKKVEFNYDFNHDRNMIFEIRFMDKSLQRKLYDSLKMTNYASGSSDIDVILGANTTGTDAKPKVKISNESVISSDQDGLQFTMKSLKKIKSN